VDHEKTIVPKGLIGMEYTCKDYQSEMKLLGLKRRLDEENFGEEEKAQIVQEIKELEKAMKMD
jgi:hypothetical protein